MNIREAFFRSCLIAIVLLLSVIACRQSGTSYVQAAADAEYFIMPLESNQKTFIQLSEQLNSIASELGGKLHTLDSVGMGTAYIAVFEVPKGTVAKVKNKQQK